MKHFLGIALTTLALSFPAYAGLFDSEKPDVAPPAGAPMSFSDLSEKLSPAVVNISSTQKVSKPDIELPDMPEFPPGSPFEDFFKDYMERQQNEGGMSELPTTSLGSGFIIDASKGLVVTNNHVISDAQEVRVTLSDNTILDATILGRDDKTDLAILKVDPKGHKLSAVTFGNSDGVRVGDWVLAIGNPFGLGGTVTAGIISARKRDINAGPYDDFLQTDASINRGNSGGPMFNLKGEVIGINTAIYSPSGGSVGIGFAIPSNLAKPIVDQLVQFGKTRRGWLGVKIQSVTDEIAETMGLKETEGALVASVTPGGPAEKSKIKAGDIILEFNGQKLDAMRQLPRIVAESPIGKDVPVKIWRDGKVIQLKAKVGELEKAQEEGLIEKADKADDQSSKGAELSNLGITIAPITSALRQSYNIPEDVEGIVVTKVAASATDALQKGLSAGDVIIEINQQPVQKIADAATAVNAARNAGKTSILLLVDFQGQGDVRFVALKLKPVEKKPTEKAPEKK